MTAEEQNVTYYYIKKASVKVEYIDKLTGKVLYSTEIAGSVGDTYKTEEKQFANYDLIEKPTNASGKMTEDKITVKYYYSKKAEVEVQYIDKDTNKQLQDKVQINGHVGDNYKTEQKEIPYYNFTESTTNTSGKMTDNKITVKYFYTKQIFNLKVEQWIDSVTMNGKKQSAASESNQDKTIRLEVNKDKIADTDIKVTYKIKVSNVGEIEGQVGMLTEVIPVGFKFYQEDNQIKWENVQGRLTTTDLKDVVLKAGESKEIELTIRWEKQESNFGEMNGSANLTLTSNPAGYEDIDNNDNNAKSSIILSVVTGLDSNDQKATLRIVTAILLVSIVGIVVLKRKNRK